MTITQLNTGYTPPNYTPKTYTWEEFTHLVFDHLTWHPDINTAVNNGDIPTKRVSTIADLVACHLWDACYKPEHGSWVDPSLDVMLPFVAAACTLATTLATFLPDDLTVEDVMERFCVVGDDDRPCIPVDAPEFLRWLAVRVEETR